LDAADHAHTPCDAYVVGCVVGQVPTGGEAAAGIGWGCGYVSEADAGKKEREDQSEGPGGVGVHRAPRSSAEGGGGDVGGHGAGGDGGEGAAAAVGRAGRGLAGDRQQRPDRRLHAQRPSRRLPRGAAGPETLTSDARPLLRHTSGTLAVQAFPLTDVKAYMGHADVQTTMIYVHHVPRHDAADRLSRLLAESVADEVGCAPGARSGSEDPESADFQAESYAGGGTRTPDTRIMIPLL